MALSSFRILGFLFATGCVFPAVAGVFSVEVDPTGKNVIVDANEAGLDEVLTKLGEAEGFTLKRLHQDEEADLVSGRFEGPVSTVLMHILARENHIIENSSDTKAGIARIVLYGAIRKTPAQDQGTNVLQSTQVPVPVTPVTPQANGPKYRTVIAQQQVPPVQPIPVSQPKRWQPEQPRPAKATPIRGGAN